MAKIQIICTNPGMRRLGTTHPASATYDEGRWTKEQLEVFRADPAFHVSEVAEDGVVTRGPEFDAAVAAEVNRLLKEKVAEMQAGFTDAVTNAAAEKVADLQRQLAAANQEIASMPAKVNAAVELAMKDVDPALLEKVKAQAEEIAKPKGKNPRV